MKKAIKPLYFIVLTLFLCLISAVPLWADENQDTFSIDAKAAIAVDADTGKIFYAQDSTTPLPIASITKVLSIYVVYDQIKAGKLSLQDQVTISPELASLSVQPDLSNVPLVANASYTVEELIHASLIQSANAAVMALGEKVAGNQKDFVDMMRQKAESLDIHDAKIISVSGLNNSYLGDFSYPGSASDEENEMSAQDVAIIASQFIKDYPEVLNITSTAQETFGANSQQPSLMTNWNQLLPGLAMGKPGVLGLKTGTTDLAGACFVGVIDQNNRRVITVVLHANNQENDPSARFVETNKLMDYALNQWQAVEVLKAEEGIPNLTQVDVKNGKTFHAAVTNQKSYTLWLPVNFDRNQLSYEVTLSDKVIEAPIKINRKVGNLTISNPQDPYGYLPHTKDASVQGPIIATESVQKANFFVIIYRNIKDFFSKIF